MSDIFIKQPAEITQVISWDFAAQMPEGVSIVSAIVTIRDMAGAVQAAMLVEPAQIDNKSVLFRVQGGSNGQDYNAQILATLSNGSIPEGDVLIRVRDGAGAVSGGFLVGDILPEITRLLKTNVETGAYALSNKIAAISEALRDCKMAYKPEEYYEPDTTITFTNRMANVPADYLIWVKLFEATSGKAYTRVRIDQFDGLSGPFWTERGGLITVADDTASLRMRYIARSDDLSDVADRILLPEFYRTGFARVAAGKLLEYDGKLAEADRMTRIGHEMISAHLAVDANQKEEATMHRIRSVFDDEDLFAGLE